MRLLLDEDSQGRGRVRLLREAGHDVLAVSEAGLLSHSDAEVFTHAKQEGRALVTRNIRDFFALHKADSGHSGILAEHQDCDPEKNMSDTIFVRAKIGRAHV